MNKGICYIVGAGDCNRLFIYPTDNDMVIAVDGGYRYLEGQRIDLVVGDFDSLSFVPEHENRIQLPVMKDDTDMLFAIKEGLKKGYTLFHIYGGTGGRNSHTIANLQCLSFLAGCGARGILFDGDASTTLIQNDSLTFSEDCEGYLSVFAFGGSAAGVTLEGLKYTLQDAVLTCDMPLGVSNEFIGVPATVSVKDGSLLIIHEAC